MHPDFRTDFDVIVVGGGIAGSSVARGLGGKGIRTALVERRTRPPEKSLFINGDKLFPLGMLDALASKGVLVPCPDFLLVNADNKERGLEIKQNQDANTYAVFHGPVIEYLQAGFTQDVEIINARAVSSKESPGRVEVGLDSGSKITGTYAVDATGNYSQLSRIHKVEGRAGSLLDDDPLVLWVKGVRAYGEFQPGQMLDPIGRDIGLSWVLPYSADYADVIAADFSRLSEINPVKQMKTFQNLVQFCKDNGLCTVTKVEASFSGFIRTQPISKFAARDTKRLFALGDAAGMGSPLMAEVVPAALYWGGKLADFIEAEKSPAEFYDHWRRKEQLFPYDLELAMLNRRMRRQAAGEYGSNAPIYKQILSGFSADTQRQILTERKIPASHLLPFLGRVLGDMGLTKYLAELSWDLIKVKLDYV